MLWPVIANCLHSPTLRALIWPINMVRCRSATVFSPLYVLTGTITTTGNVSRESLVTPLIIQVIRKHLQK